MKPEELIEIEAKMTPGPCRVVTDKDDFPRLQAAADSLNPYGIYICEFRSHEHKNAEGICSARNTLKDLAELWAWAEDNRHLLYPFVGSEVCAKLQEILTRLRGV